MEKSNNIYLYTILFSLGLVSSFSLSPYNLYFINFFSISCLFYFFYLNYSKGKIQSFFIGWFFGFGYFLSNLYWISNSLIYDPNLEKLVIVTIFLIPFFISIFYGLFTLALSFFNIKINLSSLLIFSLFFSFSEFLRGTLFGGFSWNLISFSFVEFTNFLQILSLIGTYSFNLIVITLFGVPVLYLMKIESFKKIVFYLIIILGCFLNIFYGTSIIKEIKLNTKLKINPPIKVVSPNFKMERYYFDESPEIKVNELLILSDIDEKDKVYVYPEGLINNLDFKNASFIFEEFSKQLSKNSKIVLGINTYKDEFIYNSLILYDKNFKILSKYDKNKLVPFGEFIPFEKTLKKYGLKKITFGYTSFSASNTRNVINTGSYSFLPLICYEIIFSGNLNSQNKKYDFILNISEDGWFGESIGLYQHFAHSIFRSIEEGKDVIRVANNGISSHVNLNGIVLKKLDSTEKGTFEVDTISKSKQTFFSKYGNKIFFCFIIIYITVIFLLKKKNY